jgi:hypothetical protein
MVTAQNIEVGIVGPRELFYIECSLPTGVTLAEYRRLRPGRPSLWKRLNGGSQPRTSRFGHTA